MKRDSVDIYLTDGAEVGVDSNNLASAIANFFGAKDLEFRTDEDSRVASRNGKESFRVTFLGFHNGGPKGAHTRGVSYRVSGEKKYTDPQAIGYVVDLLNFEKTFDPSKVETPFPEQAVSA